MEYEYDTSSKHQIVVKSEIIIEKIKFRGNTMLREKVIKKFKLPKIITSDIGFQLQFGFKGNDKPYSKSINQNTVYFDKNINLK